MNPTSQCSKFSPQKSLAPLSRPTPWSQPRISADRNAARPSADSPMLPALCVTNSGGDRTYVSPGEIRRPENRVIACGSIVTPDSRRKQCKDAGRPFRSPSSTNAGRGVTRGCLAGSRKSIRRGNNGGEKAIGEASEEYMTNKAVAPHPAVRRVKKIRHVDKSVFFLGLMHN